ncbi:YopX family protein [Tetragenococcus halophilus]|uniref:YopX family protein n=1 Tax=Tetragenococcus halophilus TaxID=51669 RepID=UPI0030F23A97
MIPKFRAWITEGNDMVYPQDDTNVEWTIDDLTGFIAPQENLGGGMWGMYDKYELMQSTGLYDRNGVEVYEDDIVRCSRGCPHRVIWVKEYGGSFLGGMPAWYLFGLNEGYSWTGAEEIIGNSWENPELLEDVE